VGEPCSKVRLSQDRLPIEPFAHVFLFLSDLLRANVVCSNVASRKCHSTIISNAAGYPQTLMPRGTDKSACRRGRVGFRCYPGEQAVALPRWDHRQQKRAERDEK
jgi:hypothetical protein